MQEINFLKTRSFWMLAGAVVTSVTGVPIPPELAATVGQIMSGGEVSEQELEGVVNGAVPAVLAAGAWIERVRGKMKVRFRRANS